MKDVLQLRGGVRIRRRFVVRGLVQGVGFRPFVYVLARAGGLAGSVCNDSAGVQIEVEGAPVEIERFEVGLRSDAPPLARVEEVDVVDVEPLGGTGFHIADSLRTTGGRTLASPDVATCVDCLRELADPADRRYRHPFITCVNCGPRFTIIGGLPYDRSRTTMAEFPMCARCAAEYADPANRRFHAQPIACPDCGPCLKLVTSGPHRTGQVALAHARTMLADGAVVAIKGLGGYHLACDARHEPAVAELRRRKGRGDKPFAVMVADLETVRRWADCDALEAELLSGSARPIVLLRRHAHHRLARSVAPRNPDLGLLLPYTPLHTLLFGLPGDPDGPAELVMTSGNLSGEPIVIDDDDALVRLGGLADAWLRHDRSIQVPCDDSVTRVVDGAELPIRRSRGYAPLPVALPASVAPILAVGAEVKNTCAVGEERYAWLSAHVGDMDDARTLDAFAGAQAHLQMLTGVAPGQLAADLHPGYRSTGWARRAPGHRPVHLVQHHHAHIASVMAEHGLDGSRPVIGIAFDGTGYGSDAAVWGGEVLIADYSEYHRHGHLGYVPLAGGDASVLRPYRMALAHLWAAGVDWSSDLPCVAACPVDERGVLAHQLETGLGCVPTSSMGRLFDAVASLAGVRHIADYEAQAAIELEGLSRGVAVGSTEAAYSFGAPFDAAPLIRAVAADVVAGVGPAVIGARFHAAVATAIVVLARRARADTGLDTVALSGGVFQNSLLLSTSSQALRAADFEVLRHRTVPPNDGGLALGQLMVASQRSRPESTAEPAHACTPPAPEKGITSCA